MSRPDWKDAPEWVQWVAQDADGCWHGYDVKPHLQQTEFSGHDLGHFHKGSFILLDRANPDSAWRTSLQERPGDQP